jgi:3-hydroxyisobutyrate dehydrogenase
VVDSIKDAV